MADDDTEEKTPAQELAEVLQAHRANNPPPQPTGVAAIASKLKRLWS